MVVQTEDLWLSAIKKGEFVFELPDDGHAATVDGDFKIQFQCYHADFSWWVTALWSLTNFSFLGWIGPRVGSVAPETYGLFFFVSWNLEYLIIWSKL